MKLKHEKTEDKKMYANLSLCKIWSFEALTFENS